MQCHHVAHVLLLFQDFLLSFPIGLNISIKFWNEPTHLIQIDNRLPELVLQLVEISHSDLSKVTRVVLVEIRAVVMLSTSHTTTTGMLAVLSYTTVTGRDMATAVNFVLA